MKGNARLLEIAESLDRAQRELGRAIILLAEAADDDIEREAPE